MLSERPKSVHPCGTSTKQLLDLSFDASTVAYETEQADALLASLDEAIQFYQDHPDEPFRDTERRRLFHLSTMAYSKVHALVEKTTAIRQAVDSIHEATRSANNMGLPPGITPRDMYEVEKKVAATTANRIVRRPKSATAKRKGAR